jgi:protein SCO1/2
MRYVLLVSLLVLLAACGPAAATDPHAGHAMQGDPMESGTLLDPPTTLVDFSLPSSRGGTLGLAELRGKPTLIFFGFTNCPDVCPTTMAEFQRAKAELGEQGEAVNFVLISVDPERDTPEALARYVEAFDPAFIGLQGDDATLRRIGRDFGLFYERQAPAADGSYNVDHSAAAYMLDAEGRLKMVYSYGMPYTTFVRDLRTELSG